MMENIAILMGGDSEEKKISIKSANTIYKNIDKNQYIAYQVLCVKKNEFYAIVDSKKIKINNKDFSFLLGSKQIKFEKVFMMIHGSPGEDGELCSFFESKNIPYTSCNKITSMLTFDKFKCNNYLSSLGFTVPKCQVYNKKLLIKYPCIIKPTQSGSSFGITKVNNKQNLQQAINTAYKYSNEVIIEDFIDGKEVTCAVFTKKNTIKTLPITEIISENEIFDYDAKYNGKSTEKTPAELSNTIKGNIEEISKKIYKQLKLEGIIRVDFIINNTTPYIIEINTIPGFSEESIVPQMLKCANINISTFITDQLNNI